MKKAWTLSNKKSEVKKKSSWNVKAVVSWIQNLKTSAEDYCRREFINK